MPMGIVVISCVRPSVHGLGFVYCIQSAWKKWPTIWHADVSRWLTLSIHGCLWILLLVHLSVCSFTAFFLRLGLGQRRAIVIIGRWLLPSLVDTGDICCHYWQHILVQNGVLYMYPATERLRHIVTLSLIGWAHTQNDPGDIMRYMYQKWLANYLKKKNFSKKHVWKQLPIKLLSTAHNANYLFSFFRRCRARVAATSWNAWGASATNSRDAGSCRKRVHPLTWGRCHGTN